MRLASTRSAAAVAVLCLAGVVVASGQTRPSAASPPTASDQKPIMVEDVFKNVQVLKGIPAKELMDTMGFFAAATGMNCVQCHVEESAGSWAKYADDTALKQTARKMIVMMNTINQSFFAGRRVVTCVSCHRGSTRPIVSPDLNEQYGEPHLREPEEILQQASGAPPPDQVLSKYIDAIGGAQRLATVTSIVAKGNYQGYDDFDKYPLEMYAKAPGQRTILVHGSTGDLTTTYDGRIGWSAAPAVSTPVPVFSLSGGDLDGAKIDAALSFPARIKELLSEWRVGNPANVDGRDLQVVQGKLRPGGPPVKLYFDMKSGLLVRLLRYSDTVIGRVPTQVDYEDYREVGGIKIPFKWTTTWTDGRSVSELASVQLNVPVDNAKFTKPAAPAAVSQ
jgi:photosynthetic reaction center cytochrome c subunit